MNMDALDFDGDMWDPEYCDSELRAVEASGESRYELCLYRQTQLKLNRRLTGGNVTRVTIAWQWPSDAMNKTQLKLNRRLTGGNVTRVTIAWQWPSDAMNKKCC